MLDPLLLRIISAGFALLFIVAALHKFNNKDQFLGILDAYQILPGGLASLAAKSIPIVELLLGLAWALSASLFIRIEFVPLVSSMLLTSYTMAIGINLIRGRNYIDCGCGFSSMAKAAKGESNDGGIQRLSTGLLLRNITLIVIALMAAMSPTARELVYVDYLSLVAATLAFVLLYGAFNQLLINNNAIGAWRNVPSRSAALAPIENSPAEGGSHA